jgi:hypothetical protein
MITTSLLGFRPRFARILGRAPRVVAVFSYRYDAHLVPDLIENLRPIVDGYAAFDDRGSTELFSSEPKRRQALVTAARGMGAQWVLFIDPDERHEVALAGKMREFTAKPEPVVWGFNYRELYEPDAYRVDGLWRKKKRFTLFPLIGNQEFDDAALHGPHHPKGYQRRLTGLNVYHLRMILRDRRVARRDLYQALDPTGAFQASGYDYLADDKGLKLRRIPKGRQYRPAHREDGGLWAPNVPPPR